MSDDTNEQQPLEQPLEQPAISEQDEDFADLESDPMLAAIRARLEAGTSPGEEIAWTPEDDAIAAQVLDDLSKPAK